MFPERDPSKVKFFCETLVSAYSREFSNFFFDKLKPIVSSLKFGVSAYSLDRLLHVGE